MDCNVIIESIIKGVNEDIRLESQKRSRLKELDLMVLDNSIRESTVGQLRGHTLENKWKIYDEVYTIISSFYSTRMCPKSRHFLAKACPR